MITKDPATPETRLYTTVSPCVILTLENYCVLCIWQAALCYLGVFLWYFLHFYLSVFCVYQTTEAYKRIPWERTEKVLTGQALTKLRKTRMFKRKHGVLVDLPSERAVDGR